VLLTVFIWQLVSGSHDFQPTGLVVGLIIDVCLFAGWFLVPSATQVRQAGDKYAHQLLQAAVTLKSAPQGGRPAAPAGGIS
jgi:hypothetical protein